MSLVAQRHRDKDRPWASSPHWETLPQTLPCLVSAWHRPRPSQGHSNNIQRTLPLLVRGDGEAIPGCSEA